MPVVRVEMWPGRTPAQKAALVAALTEAMVKIAGADRQSVTVILYEVSPHDWGEGGRLCARLGEGGEGDRSGAVQKDPDRQPG